jgi:hypothetical protein
MFDAICPAPGKDYEWEQEIYDRNKAKFEADIAQEPDIIESGCIFIPGSD